MFLYLPNFKINLKACIILIKITTACIIHMPLPSLSCTVVTGISCKNTDMQLLFFNSTSASFGDIFYTGMMYHKHQRQGYWKTMFTVTKDLEVLNTVGKVT